MVDQSLRWPEGIAKDVQVKIQDYYVPIDFLVSTCREMKTHRSSWGDLSSTPLTQSSILDLDKSIFDFQRYAVNLIVILTMNSRRSPDQGGGANPITVHSRMDGLDFLELQDPMT
jgi:hypothetical protein